jgi:hypothetical protein
MGKVSQADMDATIDKVLLWPCHAAWSGGPVLPDYSDHANDHAKPIVWNTVAALAGFLLNARFHTDSARKTACETKGTAWKNACQAAYNSSWGGWPYQVGSTSLQDFEHGAVLADRLSPWIGWTAAQRLLASSPGAVGEENFINGAGRLLTMASPTNGIGPYIDQLVGRKAVFEPTGADARPYIVAAWHCIMTHKRGLEL